MITKCKKCKKYFEDEFRSYICPHDAFPANDGNNNFKVHNDSYLGDSIPTFLQKPIREDNGTL
jgi:hypothetical protein